MLLGYTEYDEGHPVTFYFNQSSYTSHQSFGNLMHISHTVIIHVPTILEENVDTINFFLNNMITRVEKRSRLLHKHHSRLRAGINGICVFNGLRDGINHLRLVRVCTSNFLNLGSNHFKDNSFYFLEPFFRKGDLG